jgi:hypothetical protein
MLKDFLNTVVISGTAFEVLVSSNLLSDSSSLVCKDDMAVNKQKNINTLEIMRIFTCSAVTGEWLVFLSSSIVFGSLRKSFFRATRMIG